MLFGDHLCLLRGGGDLGTGVALRLHRAGFPVAVCELESPLAVRRTVALSTAVTDGETTVDGLTARRVERSTEVAATAATGVVPVLVSPELPDLSRSVVVDARLAKHTLDTTITDASLVVALGPGFTAGTDCHAVVETLRGPRLGRVIWGGSATADTGVPGMVGGHTSERVLRAPTRGTVTWKVEIGDTVRSGDVLGQVSGLDVATALEGAVRGLIADGSTVEAGMKIGDVDPRGTGDDGGASMWEVSDKALSVGGGVLEAVLTWLDRSS
ncbi:MAG: selenium-dependent molybdenum cofactor biosynthesis protein YqeB [Acidimicrobiales bacterium]|nr:selenium-dependent molybdenum cofactor biosynthesis protein YqeB [Acidimicrobiales bacterium]